MKIIFITDNFPPEVNAPASRTYDHCKEWVANGDEVTVITCAPNFPQGKVYDGYHNKLYQTEVMDGIKVIRVWSYIYANKGFVKRSLDFISFSITSFFAGLFKKADIIIATSPQFFSALSGRTLGMIKRIPWVMEVRDLWPESIKTVGALKQSAAISYFELEELYCYRKAAKIIVVTDSFKRKLMQRGVKASKIEVIKNGVNRELFTPMLQKDQELLAYLNLSDKIIIGYIGTHGMAHKLDFILHCAKDLESDNPQYHFIFLGNGAEKDNLIKLKNELGLKNVTFLDSVPKTEVKRYISILDVCLINLKKSDLFKTVIPSKIFENAAMEIPILMGVDGEARQIVEGYNAGICFEPENREDFKLKLTEILKLENREEFKAGSRRLAADFDRKTLARKMQQVLHSVINK